jgi:hypothetical protein
MLLFDSPNSAIIPNVSRPRLPHGAEDFEICGNQVCPGQEILFMLGSANRDPRQFKDPDRLDLTRATNPHLAFGAGAHSRRPVFFHSIPHPKPARSKPFERCSDFE